MMQEYPERRFLERTELSKPMGLPEDIFDKPEKYDENIPLWRRTVGLVKQYQVAKPKGREKLLDQLASEMIRNPARLVQVLNNLDLIRQVRSEETVDEIKNQIEPSMSEAIKKIGLRLWTPAKIEEIVKLSLDSQGDAKNAYMHMATALFNAPRTVEEAVDLEYNAAWAMITTDKTDVREEICSILCFERSIYEPSSLTAYLFLCGNGLTDDVHIQRHVATNESVGEATRLFEVSKGNIDIKMSPRLEHKFSAVTIAFAQLPRQEQLRRSALVTNLERKYGERYKKFENSKYEPLPEEVERELALQPVGFYPDSSYLDEIKRRQRRESALENLQWPHNLFYSFKDPLSQYITRVYGPKIYNATWENYVHFFLSEGYTKLTEEPFQIAEDLNLEAVGKGFNTPEQKSAVIRKIYGAIIGGNIDVNEKETLGRLAGADEAARLMDGIMVLHMKDLDVKFSISQRLSEEDSGRLSSIIQFHRPVLSLEEVRSISEQTSQTRQGIKHFFTRSVGARGFEMVISDPALINLGYRSISFKLDESRKNINTTLDIMGQKYVFHLDGDYRIIFGEDVKKFRNYQDQAWLELLVLSHLKKLMCFDEETIGRELVGGEKQIEVYKSQTQNRSEHLRRLHPGQRFSSDAFQKCLKSDLPIKDLFLINRARASIGYGGTVKTGMWTYVSPVERIDATESKPVKIAFKNATYDIRKVIPLGQVSDEELARVEQEILAELEIN